VSTEAVRKHNEQKHRTQKIARAMQHFPSFCALLQYIDYDSGVRHPMRLTPVQAAYCARRTARDIILKPRKVFMTSLEVAYDLWWFLMRKGARVVIVCQSEKDHQAMQAISVMVRVYLESLRRFMPLELDQESSFEWKLHSRDAHMRIMEAGASNRTAVKGGRGTTVNRLHLSEVAFYEYAGETLNTLVNAMPQRSASSITIESTPNGAGGYYYDTWEAAVGSTSAKPSAYRPHFFAWFEDPKNVLPLDTGEDILPRDDREKLLIAKGVSLEAIKWYRNKVSLVGDVDKVRQEFADDPVTCFLTSGRMFFDGEQTKRLIAAASAVSPKERRFIRRTGANGEVRVWNLPDASRDYVIGVDTAEGTGGDESAAIVRERGTAKLMAVLQGQFKPHELAVEVAKLGFEYNEADVAVERNNHGHAVLEALWWTEHYPHLWMDHDEKLGWINHEVSRSTALSALEQSHRSGVWKTYDGGEQLEERDEDRWRQRGTLTQFWKFVFNKNGRPEAAPGAKDDLVMAEGITWDVLRRPVTRRDLRNLPHA
jgi:hypothetical protein